MVFFRKKKEVPPPPQKPSQVQQAEHERVLTAEGWRRQMLKKTGRKAKKLS